MLFTMFIPESRYCGIVDQKTLCRGDVKGKWIFSGFDKEQVISLELKEEIDWERTWVAVLIAE